MIKLENIIYEKQAGMARVIINRPRVYNCFRTRFGYAGFPSLTAVRRSRKA